MKKTDLAADIIALILEVKLNIQNLLGRRQVKAAPHKALCGCRAVKGWYFEYKCKRKKPCQQHKSSANV